MHACTALDSLQRLQCSVVDYTSQLNSFEPLTLIHFDSCLAHSVPLKRVLPIFAPYELPKTRRARYAKFFYRILFAQSVFIVQEYGKTMHILVAFN